MKTKMINKTSDAVAILERRYLGTSSSKSKVLHQIEGDLDVAQQLYDLRSQAGLSQRELAKLVGTTASVICQLEDAEYQGHSLRMLHRIASALKQRVVIKFVPMHANN